MKKIAITTGDQDGIGFEVTAKALFSLGPQKGVLFFLFRSSDVEVRYLQMLQKKFHVFTVSTVEDAFDLSKTLKDPKMLIEIVQSSSPARWVEQVAELCLNNFFDSMVTAPLSKQAIQKAKMRDIGHTDILKRVTKKSRAFMCFIGDRFNVLLATGHKETSLVEREVDMALLKSVISVGLGARKFLPSSQARKPLGILGLNPHAGDQGLIGGFEKNFLSPFLRRQKNRSNLSDPLVPDVAFLPSNWKKYSFFVALYHDQGLIPFKMVHGFDSGVHLTLGLPIHRSSVDHGTAKDLFGKNRANPNSMIEALRWGIRLANRK